jgi:protein-S-isoprenylcysteine O-methyltransferase Ste14
MSLIPAFELGVWNAWIFFLLHQGLVSFSLILLFRGVWKGVWDAWKKDKSSFEKSSIKTDRRLEYIQYFVFIAVFVFMIFTPLRLNTFWFYFGLFIYLLGVGFDFMAGVSWATNPLDKPITTGIYRISRHPMDFGNVVAVIGTGIACASWLFPLLGIIMISLMNMSAVHEERFCLEKYGDSYRKYMNRTPRWIGIPKSEKMRIN